MNGIVLSDLGNRLIVDVDGDEVSCVVRKSLRRDKRRKAVVVGDRVTIEGSGDGAVIVAVDERHNSISRRNPGNKHREQILVANLDAVLVVASAKSPDLVPGIIDRFLVAAESREMEPAIAINKIDLDPDAGYQTIADVYRGLGYTVLETSATAGDGLQDARDFLTGKTTAMLGHSGVGKSALANALDRALELRTGEVHAGTGLGTHTTSHVSLLCLPWGGYLVDTPGIREFGLWGMDLSEVRFRFREIEARQGDCRFNDCLHEREPDCAVKQAVDAGEITGWRYESYQRILASLREP